MKKIDAKIVPNEGYDKINSIKGDHYWRPTLDGEELHMVAETSDVALLLALGQKYEGPNSKFASYACKMLNLDTVWKL